jgi:hypothetical protein
MNTILQRMALYFTLGLVLVTLGVDVLSWQFWAVVSLFWCSEYITRKAAEDESKLEGVRRYLELSSEEQSKLKKLFQKMKELDER